MRIALQVFPLTFVILAAGCGASKPSSPKAPLTIAPLDLYPLHLDNAWSYDIDTGDESTTLAITRVDTVHGTVATVTTGKGRVKYDIRDDGIYVISDDAWLFRSPYKAGSTWPARGGRTGSVTSIDADVETPAGSFTGCLEVLETGGKLELEVRTVYCPFIGPVSVVSTMRSNVSDRSATVRALLRGYEVDGASLNP